MAERIRELKIKVTPSMALLTVDTNRRTIQREFYRELIETELDLLKRAAEATVDEIHEIRRNR